MLEGDRVLIAEAGTVLHETGKTPRQLADEVERLKQQADEARGFMSKHRGNATGLHMAMWGWAERYDAALAEQQQSAGERA